MTTKRDFNKSLARALPVLREHALRLTRDPNRVDDVVQDALLRALAAGYKVDHPFSLLQRVNGTLGVPSTLKYWVSLAALHDSLRESRFLAKHGAAKELGVFPIISPAGSPDVQLELKEIAGLIETLPPMDRTALAMSVEDGMTSAAIGDRTGATAATVRGRIGRARLRLRVRAGMKADESAVSAEWTNTTKQVNNPSCDQRAGTTEQMSSPAAPLAKTERIRTALKQTL